MKSKFIFLLAGMLLCATSAFAAVAVVDDGTYEGEATTIDFTGNSVSFDGTKATVSSSPLSADLSTDAGSYKYEYMPIAYVSDNQIRIGGIATALSSSGSAAGSDEFGSTEGYATSDDDEDYIRFSFPLPSTMYDGNQSGDFGLAFDVSETGAAVTVTGEVRVFQRANTTPIFAGHIIMVDQDARAFKDTTMTGTTASLTKDNVLMVEVTSKTDTDDFNIYGARLKYRPGIDFD